MILSKRNLLFTCVAILIGRIVWMVIAQPQIHHVEDWTIASNLSKGFGYTLNLALGPTALKAPVYVLFLAVHQIVFGDYAIVTAAIVQHALMILSAWLLYLCCRRVLSERTSIIASLMFLLHPSYLFYPTVLESTNLTIPLMLWWVICLSDTSDKSRIRTDRTIVPLRLAISSALLTLCQPLTFIPVFAIFWFVFKGSKKTLVAAALLTAILIAPWAIRNAFTFSHFIPFKSPVWMNVYRGFDTESHGIPSLDVIPDSIRSQIATIEGTKNDVEMEAAYREVAVQAITSNPGVYFQKFLVQAAVFWSVPPRYWDQLLKPGFVFVRLIPVIVLNLSILILLLRWRRHNFNTVERRLILSIVSILAYATVVYALSASFNVRFKLDFEWMQCVLFAILISDILQKRFLTLEAPAA